MVCLITFDYISFGLINKMFPPSLSLSYFNKNFKAAFPAFCLVPWLALLRFLTRERRPTGVSIRSHLSKPLSTSCLNKGFVVVVVVVHFHSKLHEVRLIFTLKGEGHSRNGVLKKNQ